MGIVKRRTDVQPRYRGELTREVFMGIYDIGRGSGNGRDFVHVDADWILAPSEGMGMSPEGWSTSNSLLIGATASATGPYRGKKLSLSWPVCDAKHVAWLSKVDRLCASRTFFVTLWTPNMTNLISPLIGYPALHETTYSPYAWSSRGERRAVAGEDDSLVRSTSTGDIVDYDEPFFVPAGYQVLLEFETIDGKHPEVWLPGNNGWSYYNITSSPHALGASPDKHRMMFVRYGGGRSATGKMGRARVNIRPLGAPQNRSPIVETPPMGFCRLKPVPGSLSIQLNSAPLDYYTASIDFQEVWPWL